MKKFIFLFFFILSILDSFSQSSNHNYIYQNVPQVPVSNVSDLGSLSTAQNFQSIQYFDGLGRLVQTVKKEHSPSGKDFIQPVEYDNFGRDSIEYLPYTDYTQPGGGYYGNYNSAQHSFYTSPPTGVVSSTKPTSRNVFDNSPLNQVIEKGFAGEDWQVWGSHHTLRTENTNNQSGDSVRLWVWNESGFPNSSDNYPAGTLYKVITLDENADTTVEYTDKIGHTILTEHFVSGRRLRTYYIYDDFGRLSTVISPQGESLIRSTVPCTLGARFDSVYSYVYTYDARGRMTTKQIPGQDTIKMQYDNYDRLTYMSDGNLRSQNKKLYYLYDELNRQTVKGIQTGNYKDPVEYTYYDNYDFDKDGFPDYSYQQDNDFPNNTTDNTNIGRVTGTNTLVFDAMNSWITVPVFYDKYDRVLQTQNPTINGGKDIFTNGYDFSGRLLKAKQTHQVRGLSPTEPQTIVKEYDYDNGGRLIDMMQSINNEPRNTICQTTYNELDQLIQKDLGGLDQNQFLQSLHYGYNIRGWLKNINYLSDLGNSNALFAEELGYNEVVGGNGGQQNLPIIPNGLITNPQYNGNISYALWGTLHNGSQLAYSYQYDHINRIIGARFAERLESGSWKYTDKYTETGISYDDNGNFLTVNRHGYFPQTQDYGIIDSLTYFYYHQPLALWGNKLQAVRDLQTISSGYDFSNSERFSIGDIQYTYDKNGNLTSDVNKGIVNITYNYLNLPEIIDMGRNNLIHFLYDANGVKLRSTLYLNGKLSTTVDYVNGFVYQDNNLDFIAADEGRILYTRDKYVYEYQIKDHLGNVRVCFADLANDGTITVTQERSYYPFGLAMQGLNYDSVQPSPYYAYTVNEYKYNHKEFQEFFGLQWYDYGARFYDPQLGRWHSIDPLCELGRRWSPYSYAFNNPLKFTDPDGKWGNEADDPSNSTIKETQTAEQDFKEMTATKDDGDQNQSNGIEPVSDKNKKNISKVSWGETSGLYPVNVKKNSKGRNIKPKNSELNNPENWDANLLQQLLKARAAINLLSSRNGQYYASSPNLDDPIDKLLAAYHLTNNFPEVDSEIKDDSEVKYFYLSSDANATTPSISSKYWDQRKVKTYGPFYAIGGGDAGTGLIYIHFYKAIKKTQ
jgi:RHS repeat-associated protein